MPASLIPPSSSLVKEATTRKGQFRVWSLSPTVHATSLVGHMEEPHADLFLRFSQERVAAKPGALYAFHDWLDMTGYDSVCRTRLTEWSVRNLDAFAEVHIGIRSKLVAMAVQVANIALRGLITVHPGKVQLEAALHACLTKHA